MRACFIMKNMKKYFKQNQHKNYKILVQKSPFKMNGLP